MTGLGVTIYGRARERTSDELAEELWDAVETSNLAELNVLMKQGVDPNYELYWSEGREDWDSGRLPPLHHACKHHADLDIIKVLVEGGADIERGDRQEGRTPFHWACETQLLAAYDFKKIAEYMTKVLKCNVDARDKNGRTPLHLTCMEQDAKAAMFLIEETSCDLNIKDDDGETPLDKVLNYTYLDQNPDLIDLARALINRGCGNEKNKGNLLGVAAQLGILDLVKELVEKHNVNPKDVVDEFGETPLERAMDPDHDEEGTLEVAFYLIDHCGCGGENEKVQLLCQACETGNKDLVKKVIERYQIDPRNVTWKGLTPVELTLDHYSLDFTSYSGCLDTAKHLIDCGYGSEWDKEFLMIRACEWGVLSLVKELIEKYKINPRDVIDSSDHSPLDHAIGHNCSWAANRSECIDVALFLINNFACGNQGRIEKLFFEASTFGRLDALKELIEDHSINEGVILSGYNNAVFRGQPEAADYLKSLLPNV